MINTQFIYWNQLPSETQRLVLSYLDQKTLRKTRDVSKKVMLLAEGILKKDWQYEFVMMLYANEKRAQAIKQEAKVAAPLKMPILAVSFVAGAALPACCWKRLYPAS